MFGFYSLATKNGKFQNKIVKFSLLLTFLSNSASVLFIIDELCYLYIFDIIIHYIIILRVWLVYYFFFLLLDKALLEFKLINFSLPYFPNSEKIFH